jgi:hypothetical protein
MSLLLLAALSATDQHPTANDVRPPSLEQSIAALGWPQAAIDHLKWGAPLNVHNGSIWRATLSLDGLRVLDTEMVVRLDPVGGLISVRSAGPPPAFAAIDGFVRSDESARAAAMVWAKRLAVAPGRSVVERAWRAEGGALHPTHLVRLASPFPLYAFELRFDAVSGTLLRSEALHHNAEANIFAPSPGADRALERMQRVELDPRPDGDLVSHEFSIRTCCIQEGCDPDAEPIFVPVDLQGFNAKLGTCDELPMARADDDGNFIYEARAYDFQGRPGGTTFRPLPADVTERDAPHKNHFTEGHAYHHAHIHMAFVRDRGLNGFDYINRLQRDLPMQVSVNYMIPSIPFGGQAEIQALMGQGCIELTSQKVTCFYPMDNAMFFPAIGRGTGAIDLPIERSYDSVILFQGSLVNFGYDGGVIHHELTHATIHSTSNLRGVYRDEQGTMVTAGALHEGYADYVAMAINEDPVIGAYVGGPGGLRDQGTPLDCATTLIGEVHEDGRVWASNVWGFRSTLNAGERPSFDRAVIVSMAALPGEGAGFDRAAEGLVEEVERDMGAETAGRLRDALTDRGVLGCRRVRPLNRLDEAGNSVFIEGKELHLPSPDSVGLAPGAFAPPTVQFSLEMPAGTRSIQLTWATAAGGQVEVGGGQAEGPTLEAFAKEGSPMTFTYSGDESRTDGKSFPIELEGIRGSLTITGLDRACAETLFITVGSSDAATVMSDIDFQLDVDPALAETCDAPQTDIPGPLIDGDPVGGCACTGSNFAGLALLLLPILGRRRRRSVEPEKIGV